MRTAIREKVSRGLLIPFPSPKRKKERKEKKKRRKGKLLQYYLFFLFFWILISFWIGFWQFLLDSLWNYDHPKIIIISIVKKEQSNSWNINSESKKKIVILITEYSWELDLLTKDNILCMRDYIFEQ